MSNLKNKVALVIDNGLFVDVALKLSEQFGKVLYWSPWQSAFPSSSKMLPGDGFDEIERIKWRADAMEKADVIVYPDVYYGDEQAMLDKKGYRIWGSRKGESLELNRVAAKKMMKSIGLPVGPYAVIHGLEELRAYLKDHSNVWVKLSANRGDAETFHVERYDLIEPRLDELEHRLGAKKTIIEFIVEDSIEPAVEFGYDGFTIDGQWPVRTFFGLERKDLGFIGKVIEYDYFPAVMKHPNTMLEPFFAQNKYRGWYSSELRITDKDTAYLIDPCCRAASPPHEIYLEIFDNWPEIVWNGSAGEMTEPNATAQYGVCAMIHSAWATKNWLPVRFPESIRRFVKLRNHCRIDGVDYFVPQPDSDLPEIGAVVGLGNTLEEAKQHLLDNAAQVEGYDLDIKTDCIESAEEEIEEAKQYGIDL